jgi:predicted RNA binding protein YcfA (HicA-like mRNA interferase family)
MSPAAPGVSGEDLVDSLSRHGFVVVANAAIHCAIRGRGPGRTVVVPLHDELADGTIAAVLGLTGFRLNELPDLLS